MKIALKKILKEKNLSLRKASQLTDVPKSTLGDIMEKGAIPRVDTLRKIAVGLNVKINDLIENEDN